MGRPGLGGAPHRDRHATSVLLAGTVLIAVAWMLPLRSPPLYDGLEAPAEPYRYLQPGPGLPSTGAPSTAHETLPVQGSAELKSAVSTGEMPPQAQLFVSPQEFVLPARATAVDVAITPVPAPAPVPQGRIAGNVYRIAATAEDRPLALRHGAQLGVLLRSPAGLGAPTLELFDAGRWTRLATRALTTVAPDLYGASLTELGDVALVVAAAPPANGSPVPPAAIAGAAAAALLAAGTILLRARARRRGRPCP